MLKLQNLSWNWLFKLSVSSNKISGFQGGEDSSVSSLWRRVMLWEDTDVSEDLAASIKSLKRLR